MQNIVKLKRPAASFMSDNTLGTRWSYFMVLCISISEFQKTDFVFNKY